MSLQGRRWVDNIRHNVKRYLRLPSPPYGSPKYWTSCYRNFKEDAVFEWGDLVLDQDLLQYEYRDIIPNNDDDDDDEQGVVSSTKTASWAETLQVDPNNNNSIGDDHDTSSSMILGCGYSNLGRDMAARGWKNIIQVDNSSKVISDLSSSSNRGDGSQCIEDDANVLSAFDANTMDAIIDKGLMDCLSLDYQEEQMTNIMTSVQRVLKPRGVFLFFSLSRPEYILPILTQDKNSLRTPFNEWESVEVRELDEVILYRYQKKIPEKQQLHLKKIKKKVKRIHSRRQ